MQSEVEVDTKTMRNVLGSYNFTGLTASSKNTQFVPYDIFQIRFFMMYSKCSNYVMCLLEAKYVQLLAFRELAGRIKLLRE